MSQRFPLRKDNFKVSQCHEQGTSQYKQNEVMAESSRESGSQKMEVWAVLLPDGGDLRGHRGTFLKWCGIAASLLKARLPRNSYPVFTLSSPLSSLSGCLQWGKPALFKDSVLFKGLLAC